MTQQFAFLFIKLNFSFTSLVYDVSNLKMTNIHECPNSFYPVADYKSEEMNELICLYVEFELLKNNDKYLR